MVQFKTYTFFEKIRSHNHHFLSAHEYWKLEDTSRSRRGYMRYRLDGYGVRYKASTSRARLRELLQRAECGLIIYDNITFNKLSTFISARGLWCYDPPTTKEDLVQCLEDADEDIVFPFLKLPPEVRLKVYGHHLLSLDTNIAGNFLIPPPITQVSKLVRKESMPEFYRLCTFHFDFNWVADKKWNFPKSADRFFEQGTILQGIKNLSITGIPRFTNLVMVDHEFVDFAIRFRLEMKADGTVGPLPQIEFVDCCERLDRVDPNISNVKVAEGALHAEMLENVDTKVLTRIHDGLVKRCEQAQSEIAKET